MKVVIEVTRPGILTTVQDLGRVGYQQYGMVVGGAVDAFSLKVANVLVGNTVGKACLEVTMGHLSLATTQDVCIAISGADFRPVVDGKEVRMWGSFIWPKGTTLTLGSSSVGCRAYLAIKGGIGVPSVMKSKSTYLPSKLGGLKGRALVRGDVLHVSSQGSMLHRHLSAKYIPGYRTPKKLHVILGPHHAQFTAEGLEAFFHTPYVVTNHMNRMGMRLDGEPIIQIKGSVPSLAVTFGTIQVPPSNKPVIMLADRQTTGGYPQIATVISVDRTFLAQALPGDTFTFCPVSLEEAHWKLEQEENFFMKLKSYTNML